MKRKLLIEAVEKDNITLMEWLLSNHPELNDELNSVLSMATEMGRLTILEYCMGKTDIIDKTGAVLVELMSVAIENNYIDILQYLYNIYTTKWNNVGTLNEENYPNVMSILIKHAITSGNLTAIKYLSLIMFYRGYSVEYINIITDQLDLAIKSGQYDIIKFMLNNHDLKLTRDHIQWACRCGNENITKLIINKAYDDIFFNNKINVKGEF